MASGDGAQSARAGSTSQGPYACMVCSLSTKSKPSLTCGLCYNPTHTACLSEWNDITKVPELKAIINRAGLKWYCEKCESTLSDYISGGEIQTSLDTMHTRMQALTQLVSENLQVTKTIVSQPPQTIPGHDSTVVSEIKAAVDRIDASVKTKQKQEQTEERSCNVILHGLVENNATLKELSEICDAIHFNKECMVKFSRLGRRNMSLPNTEKIRPVKITFTTEVNKRDFMYRYNSWDYKESTFCTADLTPEEREREYKLRKLRDQLRLKFTNRRFQVRNSAIYARNSPSDPWMKCEDNLDDDVDSLWEMRNNTTGQTPNNAES